MRDVEMQGYVTGAIGRVTELHANYYQQNWKFGIFFETKVATELAEFLNRFDRSVDGFWTICQNNQVQGSIAIDGIKSAGIGAHLRWFILAPNLHGHGFGNKLMEEAISFCSSRNYNLVYLWTFKGLDAARYLYEKFGFKLVEQHAGTQWGTRAVEQKFELKLRNESNISS